MPAGQSLPDSQANIRNNALFYKGKLSTDYTPEERQQLAKYLVQKCYLVIVSSSDEESAFRIFSVLNDRGMQLSQADILKAEIIGAIPKDEQETYTEKWEDAETNLGIESFRDLFTHIRMIVRKNKAKDTIIREIRDSIRPNEKPKDFIDEMLIPYSNAFYDVINTSFESVAHSEEINKYLRWLNKFDNYDWIPAAIYSLSKWGKTDTKKLSSFLMRLERLAFALWLMGENINGRIERYSKVLSDIENNQNLFSGDCSLSLSKQECDKIYQRLSGDVYGERFTKYLLLRLDYDISGGEATYNYPIISIEHVLPQNPREDSEWLSIFKDESEREELTHCLGNLVLLSRRKNSAAQNYEFERKKSNYFMINGVSSFPLTTDVLTRGNWTPDVIMERKENLLKRCKNIWNL